MRYVAIVLSVGVASVAAPVLADDKEDVCQFQADMIGAVQAARLERVQKSNVADVILEQNPDWPEGVRDAVPAISEYVYSIKRRDLKKMDLSADTKTTCLENYEQIQALKKTITN